jgi:hypothetical protein
VIPTASTRSSADGLIAWWTTPSPRGEEENGEPGVEPDIDDDAFLRVNKTGSCSTAKDAGASFFFRNSGVGSPSSKENCRSSSSRVEAAAENEASSSSCAV